MLVFLGRSMFFLFQLGLVANPPKNGVAIGLDLPTSLDMLQNSGVANEVIRS